MFANEIDNVLIAKVPVKELPFATTEIYPIAEIAPQITSAVVHFVPSVLSSSDMYNKESIGTGFTVQGISTEIRYSENMDGVINGEIYVNEKGTKYAGTIIVRDCNTGQIVAEEYIEDGIFSIKNLNPDLKYDVECIPKDAKYVNKFVPGFEPDIYELDLLVEKLGESTAYSIVDYSAIFRVKNDYGTLSVNAAPINGINNLVVTKIADGLFKVEGTPNLKDISYNLIVSDMRKDTIKTKIIENNVYLTVKALDINFGYTTEDLFKSTSITSVGTTSVVPFRNGDGVSITGANTYISLSNNDMLNVGTNDFEAILSFKVLSKLKGVTVPLISTESSSSNTVGNFVIEIQDVGLKIVFFDGNPESSSNTLLVDYNFELNKEYTIKLARNDGSFKIYINDILEFNSGNFYSKNMNFISGALCYFGYAKWYTEFTYNVVFESFKLVQNQRYALNAPIKEYANNLLYAIYFTDKIYDSESYNYDSLAYTVTNNKIYKKENTQPLLIKNFDGLKNIFTIEFKTSVGSSTTRQYILYNNVISIYFESNKLHFKINDEVFSGVITDRENVLVTFKKSYENIKLYVNDQSYTFTSKYKYLSIPFYANSFLLSDSESKNIYKGSLEYILFDENVYADKHMGKPLKLKYDNLDMSVDETFDIKLADPSNAIGTVQWAVTSGSLPHGITLNGDGSLFGIPSNTGRYIFKLKCTDTFGQVGYIVYNIRVGTVVTYCQFEGANAATSMTDLAGKVWTSNSSAQLRTANKQFGNSSGYFDGGSQDWTTPNSTDFNFGRDDFTISMWIYNTQGATGTHRTLISKRNNWSAYNTAWCLMRYANTNQYMFEGWNGPVPFGHQFGSAKIYEWEFITICRKGAYLYFSQNGKVEKVYFGFYIYDYNYPTAIGQGDVSNGQNFIGYIDEVKVVKGAALYTANFETPKRSSDFPASVLKTAPYNIDLQYKNKKFKIKWSHDEYDCKYNVYLSESTILANDLPTPYATNISGKEIEITTFNKTSKYYVRIAAVRGNNNKISNEKNIDINLIDTLWSPSELDIDKEVWIDLADTATVQIDSGIRVKSILNKSGKNNHCSNTNKSQMPIYNFDEKYITTLHETYIGLTGKISAPSDGTKNNYTIFFVNRPRKSTGSQYGQGNSGTSYWSYDTQTSTLMNISHSNTGPSGVVVPYWSTTTNAIAMTEQRNSLAPFNVSRSHTVGSNIMISSFVRNGTTKILKSGINGVYANGSFSTIVGLGWDTYTIFGRYNTSNAYNDIHEIILVQEELSVENIQKIEGYLAHKWGITGSLPTDHPYKTSLPISNIILGKPYNIKYTLNIVQNNIQYNFSIEGIPYDKLNYYISEEEFDINNMPVPKLTNINTSFIDDTIEIDKVYNIIISRLFDGVEYYSDQFSINTNPINNIMLSYKNKQMYWYDINDMSTLYQDINGTIPVTDVGQKVALIKDKTGNNNDMIQTNTNQQFILKYDALNKAYYLETSANDSRYMISKSVIAYNSPKFTLISKIMRTDSNIAMILETSNNSNNYTGAWYFVNGEGSYAYTSNTRGSNGSGVSQYFGVGSSSQYLNEIETVTSVYNTVDPISYIKYRNQVTSSKNNIGTINFNNFNLYMGCRGGTTLFTNTRIYNIIGIADQLTDNEIISIETYLNNYNTE